MPFKNQLNVMIIYLFAATHTFVILEEPQKDKEKGTCCSMQQKTSDVLKNDKNRSFIEPNSYLEKELLSSSNVEKAVEEDLKNDNITLSPYTLKYSGNYENTQTSPQHEAEPLSAEAQTEAYKKACNCSCKGKCRPGCSCGCTCYAKVNKPTSNAFCNCPCKKTCSYRSKKCPCGCEANCPCKCPCSSKDIPQDQEPKSRYRVFSE